MGARASSPCIRWIKCPRDTRSTFRVCVTIPPAEALDPQRMTPRRLRDWTGRWSILCRSRRDYCCWRSAACPSADVLERSLLQQLLLPEHGVEHAHQVAVRLLLKAVPLVERVGEPHGPLHL